MVNQPQIERILQAVDASTGLNQLKEAAIELRGYFGIRHVVYHCISSAGAQYGFGTYTDAWHARYLQKNYVRIDPVIVGCSKYLHPVDWKRLDWSSKAARAYFKEAMEYGVGNQGYSVPIRGPNGLFAHFTCNNSCADAEWSDFISIHRSDLLLIGHYLHHKAFEFQIGRPVEAARPLSPREIDAMTMIALGYNRAQVASSLSISEHTLRAYIESARFKLGATNTTHAVARAVSLGLIAI